MDSFLESQAPLTISLVGQIIDHNHRGDHHSNFNNNNSSNNHNNNNNSSSPNLNSHSSSSRDPPKEASSKPQYSDPSQPLNSHNKCSK